MEDTESIPEWFQAHGYATLASGKVFHHTIGNNPPQQWDTCFKLIRDDHWDAGAAEVQTCGLNASAPEGHPLNGVHPFRHEFDWGVLPQEEYQYGDAQAVRWATQILEAPQERAFFMAVGLFRPHMPWYNPARYFEQYADIENLQMPVVSNSDTEALPEEGKKIAAFRRGDWERVLRHGKWDEAVRAYLASISFADSQIGELLKALYTGPHRDSTVVAFCSDNGFHLGEKAHWHKSTLWERATHVPLILAAPGLRPAPVPCERAVSLIDLFPTLCDLCELPPPTQRLDGVSLLPLLRDPASERSRPALTTHGRGNHAMRTERWRYIRYHDGGEELYDRERDPHEHRNIAARPDLRGVIDELREALPKNDAVSAPTKDQFRFDFAAYSWTLRNGGSAPA